jgi:hypothetical protein
MFRQNIATRCRTIESVHQVIHHDNVGFVTFVSTNCFQARSYDFDYLMIGNANHFGQGPGHPFIILGNQYAHIMLNAENFIPIASFHATIWRWSHNRESTIRVQNRNCGGNQGRNRPSQIRPRDESIRQRTGIAPHFILRNTSWSLHHECKLRILTTACSIWVGTSMGRLIGYFLLARGFIRHPETIACR